MIQNMNGLLGKNKKITTFVYPKNECFSVKALNYIFMEHNAKPVIEPVNAIL